MFLYKNLSFSISSVISIPIMLIGINGGYFPAICRVCFFGNGFSNSLGLFLFKFLLSQWKFFEYYVRSCPAVFFTIQRIWIALGLSFFDLFTNFYDFWSLIGVVILAMSKPEVEPKNEWVCSVKCFNSKFTIEWENGVWTKFRFLASGSHAAISHWFLLFFQFFGSDFC